MKVAVIGCGNGGLAIAGSLAARGHDVRLYARSIKDLHSLSRGGSIECFGEECVSGAPSLVTDCLESALAGADVVMVVTIANAHEELAEAMAPLLRGDQVVLLNPGRTGGALVVREVFDRSGVPSTVTVAEAQSLVYACRITSPGRVRIIGVKDCVPVAACRGASTETVLQRIGLLYSSFAAATHVLETSLQNVGAVFHPPVAMLNAAAIERGTKFFFYQDMTPSVAEMLTALDAERLKLGLAYGLELAPVDEWIRSAYPGTRGESLDELMRNNPAYHEIPAPESLSSRLLTEDIPTGLVPFVVLGAAAGLRLPLMESIVHLGCSLLKRDFWAEGRTAAKMGVSGMRAESILRHVQ